MKETVYLETTVISYLAAQPSRDLIVAACQEITRTWWQDRRHKFDLFISERVIAEANCKHIANARIISKIQQIAIYNDFRSPTICTPQELIEDYI
jgi:hypothetical protein